MGSMASRATFFALLYSLLRSRQSEHKPKDRKHDYHDQSYGNRDTYICELQNLVRCGSRDSLLPQDTGRLRQSGVNAK
jgi:hypothetical protein